MILIRFGLLFLMGFRLIALAPRLRQAFVGDAASQEVNGAAVPFQYRVERASKSKRVTGLQLALDVPDRVRFRIQRESAFDRFAKALGVAQEWQTHDRDFDAKAYLLCDDAVLLAALSRNASLRESVKALLDEPLVEVIRCSHGKVWIEADYSADSGVRDIDVARELATRILPRLLRVREELQSVGSSMWEAARDPGLRRQSILLGITLAFGLLGVVSFFWSGGLGMPRQLVVDGIATHSLHLSLGACALVTVVAWMLIGRRSRLHWVLLEVLLIGAPGLWFVTNVGSELQNQRYDASRPEIRAVHVDSKYMERGSKGRKRYYLSISGWPDARVDTTLQVFESQYSRFSPPTCAHVTWHAGSLGDPWISDLAPAKCGDLVE